MSLTPKFDVPMLLPLILLVLLSISTAKGSDSTPLHEVLRNHGLPEGLFPQGVRSYKLDQNGALEVHLGRPCLTHYETRVYFDSVVKANLSFGKLKVLEGMSRQELFLWLPVKDIIVTDPSSGLIVIDIGFAFKHLSFSRFDNSPTCINHPPPTTSLGLAFKFGGRKGIGFSDQ
ncbi:unnamed protein product [Lupinus luteus]|uniref:Transmembrane protein n=1 Tax=Lupinus luteus TaxID=3873 RepID=A0AAV1WSU3_LUPLU